MTPDLDHLAEAIRARHADGGRILVAIVGAPASGKSALSDRLYHHLGGDKAGAAVVPMDGFHFDNGILEERGLLARKGAPETFDVGGLKRTLLALRDTQDEDVYVPLFDRNLEISRGSARAITPRHKIILVEGNYLLLDQAPWTQLHHLFDLSIYLEVPEETLRERLIDRWRGYGFDDTTATHKTTSNDLPNAQTVIHGTGIADIRVMTCS
ncbi:nucleoside triphosphate hydrolase [Thalassospira sp. HJ]|uniref:nucleoside triphosphate hydrolase n=1 Tax=Thalassospira sp. HJ TaxID=1616823 RepID=UPI0005CE21DE|nr:nucleoside triphosphate hydrolase [Thalassospira sp. HJ]KJE35771.1 nucleoside triphosphate hydrolase [Thalassospira sp. HJ]